MENVLVAVILIFLLLFGGLTLSSAVIAAQQTIIEASQALNARAEAIRHTAVLPAAIRILNSGGSVDLLVKNTGSARLTDFERWDVFIEYFDDAALPAYHAERLAYDDSLSSDNTWAAGAIYYDWENNVGESYEPGILNPSEQIILHLKLDPVVGADQTASVTVATDNGVTLSTQARRSVPVFTHSVDQRVSSHGINDLKPESMMAKDQDNPADELTYTITVPPTQGTLSPDTTFTQQQIDDGDVSYTTTGTGTDTISFTVSDGDNEIGPYSVPLIINNQPQLAANAGLTLLAGGTSTITNGLLQTTDADAADSANKLVYTVTQPPANGALSLGSTFTQADIDGNLLTYTSVGTSSDLFKFIVSDGYDVIGTYSFVITVLNPTATPEPTPEATP